MYPIKNSSSHQKDQTMMPTDHLEVIEVLLERDFGRSQQQMDMPPSNSDKQLITCLLKHYGYWSRMQAV